MNTVIDIPEYGIFVDMKEIDKLYLKDEYTSREYHGVLAENGFETLTIKLNSDDSYEVDTYISIFDDEADEDMDGQNILGYVGADNLNKAKISVANFIKRSERLTIETIKDGIAEKIQIKDKHDKDYYEDKDGDHIPDRIDGTYSADGHITQSDVQTADELNADIITISELSPYFSEDKKATIRLDEETTRFLISKSPELEAVLEDKNNIAEAYIDANYLPNIGITVFINSNNEYSIPLSIVEQIALKDKLEQYKNEKKTESAENVSTQSEAKTVSYWRAIVTEDECSKLDKADFPYDKSRKRTVEGKIPIRFKVELKQEFQKIISSSATIKVGGKIGG